MSIVVAASLLLAVLAAGGLVRLFRRERAGTLWFVVLWAALLCAGPYASSNLAAVVGTKRVVHDDLGNLSLAPYSAPIFISFLAPLLVCGSLAIALSAIVGQSRANMRPSALVVAALLGVALSSYAAVPRGPWIDQMIMILALAAAVLVNNGKSLRVGVCGFALLICVFNFVAAVLHPEISSAACNYKCGPLGVLFYGVFDNENVLAITILMCLPFALTLEMRSSQIAVALPLLGTIAISGSRSALIAAVLGTGVWGLTLIKMDRVARAILVSALCVVLVLLDIVTPLLADDPNAFTGRGRLWALAESLIASNPIFGGGAGEWNAQAAIGAIVANASYSPHNIFLDCLLVGGIFSFVLVVFATVLLAVSSSAPVRAAIYFVPVLAIGVTERPFAFYTLSALGSFFFPLFFGVFSAPRPCAARRTFRARLR